MGNFGSILKAKRVLRIMRANDGKVLEFRAPMRVKDLLVRYPDSYVGIFREATQPLPLDYKLKIGKIYYLLPCFSTTFDPTALGAVSSVSSTRPSDGARRIKVVITKQQLQQLLSNQVRLEDLVTKIRKIPCKPDMCRDVIVNKLESIPEESEPVF